MGLTWLEVEVLKQHLWACSALGTSVIYAVEEFVSQFCRWEGLNIQLLSGSGAGGPALTRVGDTVSFSSCCKALQLHHTIPGGAVALNCYSQWEIKDCGNESPWESQAWYKAELQHKYKCLSNYTRRMPDFRSVVRAGEFGSDYTEKINLLKCMNEMGCFFQLALLWSWVWFVPNLLRGAVGPSLWQAQVWSGNWFGLQSLLCA